jgi:hypothetical protein
MGVARPPQWPLVVVATLFGHPVKEKKKNMKEEEEQWRCLTSSVSKTIQQLLRAEPFVEH